MGVVGIVKYILRGCNRVMEKTSSMKKEESREKIISKIFGGFRKIQYFCNRKHQEMPSCGTPTEFRIKITTVVKGCVSV